MREMMEQVLKEMENSAIDSMLENLWKASEDARKLGAGFIIVEKSGRFKHIPHEKIFKALEKVL